MRKMKFRSKKDILFKSIVLGSNAILALITILLTLNGPFGLMNLGLLILIVGVIVFWIWTYFGTEYELTEIDFIIRSGPIKRKIKVDRIKEIVKGRTLWIGNWPATAKKGLIIKYDNYNLVNISPETTEKFIAKILDINSGIKVTE